MNKSIHLILLVTRQKVFFNLILSTILLFASIVSTTGVYANRGIYALNLPKVQIVNLSTDPALSAVDVYVNGEKWLEDLAIEKATGYVEYMPNIGINFAFAPANSVTSSESILTVQKTFNTDKVYFLVISGQQNSIQNPLQVIVDEQAVAISPNPLQTALGFGHLAAGQSPIDIQLRDGLQLTGDLSFGQFSSYITFPAADYFLDIKYSDDNANLIGTYRISLFGSEGLTCKVIVLNSGNPTLPLRMIVVYSDGFVTPLDFAPLARVQYINTLVEKVDVFKNGSRFAEDTEQGGAEQYKIIPANIPMNIGVSPFWNTTLSNPEQPYGSFTFVFENNKKYIAVSAGQRNNSTTPLKIFFLEGAKEQADDSNKVDVKFFNGSYSHANLSLYDGQTAWASALDYGVFSSTVSATPDVHQLYLRDASGNLIAGACALDLSAYKGQSLNLYTLVNAEGTTELWMAAVDGTSSKVCSTVSTKVAADRFEQVTLSPNPANEQVRIQGQVPHSNVVNIKIYSPQGNLLNDQKIVTEAGAPFTSIVEIKEWPVGCYFVHFTSDSGATFTSRLIISR